MNLDFKLGGLLVFLREMSTSEGSVSVLRKRTRKSKSDVWDVFEKLSIEDDDGTLLVKCINCDQVFVGGAEVGTSTMKQKYVRVNP